LQVKLRGILVALAVLSGCTTNPITGRDQIIALPAVQAAHADLSFAVATSVQGIAAAPDCGQDCVGAEGFAAFALRVAAISKRLEVAVRDTDPDLFERINGFQVETSAAYGVDTGSSAGGRIVLGTGLVALEPTDVVIGFLVAREMAHVIARHAEENSGATIMFSALGLLLPGVNFIARFVATKAGANALTGSWEVQQQREADEIAMTLLEHTGLTARTVAFELDIGVRRAGLPADDWGRRYLDSVQHVDQIAASPPRYATIDR
jgi:Zn-dependent protease with chaperone function